MQKQLKGFLLLAGVSALIIFLIVTAINLGVDYFNTTLYLKSVYVKVSLSIFFGILISILLLFLLAKQSSTQELLLEKTNELERSNKSLEEFAYFVSHDLQEPMRTVSNYVELMMRSLTKKQSLEENTQKYGNYIIESTSKMREMIRSVLTYATLGSVDQYEELNLNDLIKEIEEGLKTKFDEADAKLIYGNLPIIKARKFEMVQLFQNLISNSIKFAPAQRKPQIEIDCKKEEDSLKFSFRDNGIGVKEQDFERIFETFQRVRSEAHLGTGLGLSICKKVVNTYGGDISVRSELGEWTEFTFTLKEVHS